MVSKTEEGGRGRFVKLLFEQVKTERETFSKEILKSLAKKESISVEEFRRTLALLDPYIEKDAMDRYTCWVFHKKLEDLEKASPVTLQVLGQRLQTGCVLRRGQKGKRLLVFFSDSVSVVPLKELTVDLSDLGSLDVVCGLVNKVGGKNFDDDGSVVYHWTTKGIVRGSWDSDQSAEVIGKLRPAPYRSIPGLRLREEGTAEFLRKSPWTSEILCRIETQDNAIFTSKLRLRLQDYQKAVWIYLAILAELCFLTTAILIGEAVMNRRYANRTIVKQNQLTDLKRTLRLELKETYRIQQQLLNRQSNSTQQTPLVISHTTTSREERPLVEMKSSSYPKLSKSEPSPPPQTSAENPGKSQTKSLPVPNITS
ncbi:unnamed protein product [Cyprideis torosa]|uniref:Uncharacterized protein n=1 Tax=Cyprideis torosa TaxID=163714 RepID=A0A7R8W9E3_9CRUS|nr:unnamed protein product [Cyprideis torosa]CAG0889664.1 unnamed protein product [Cyprideis torosa]